MPAAPHSAAAPRRYPDRRARRAAAKRRLRQRRLVVIAVLLAAVLVAGASPLDWWIRASSEEVVTPPPAPASEPPPAPPEPSLSPSPSPEPEPTGSPPPPVVALSGDFPTSGPGSFAFAAGEGDVLGEAGQLLRFRVAIEDGIDEDVATFGTFADATLGHEQGWTAGGDRRFQRVPEGSAHEFTIYLATSETTGRMCAAAGLYVLAPGFPTGGVSCRASGQVILNYSRWRLSVPDYVDAEVPLQVYRQMVFNHEVGHELGFGHYSCPAPGGPAPVMQQQTLSLGECRPNQWPYLDGVHHTGPPAP